MAIATRRAEYRSLKNIRKKQTKLKIKCLHGEKRKKCNEREERKKVRKEEENVPVKLLNRLK